MEARSYNPRYVRTRYRNYPIKWSDWLMYFLLSTLLGLMILFAVKDVYFAPFGWPEAILMFGA
jgi:energy-coupling factor transport system permease protein